VKTKASFRVMGPELDPDEVTRLLGLEPDYAHRRGDANLGKSGRRYADFPEGLWKISSGAGEEATVEEHLLALLERIEPGQAGIARCHELGLRADVFVGLFAAGEPGGQGIGPETCRRLGELGLRLELDYYP
jgi:hypothetical protein